jgi:Peptidyl-tRNA hydrolase
MITIEFGLVLTIQREKHLVSNYVLNKFNETEIEIINKQLENITQNFETVLSDIGLFLTKLSESK